MEKYLFIGYTSHDNRLYGVRLLKLPEMAQLSVSLSDINNYHILGSRGDHWNLLQSKSKIDLVNNNISDLWHLGLNIPVWDRAGNLISKSSNNLSIEAQNSYGKSVNYIYDLSNSIIDMSFDGFSLLYGDYRYMRHDGYFIITPDIIDESDLLCTDAVHYKGIKTIYLYTEMEGDHIVPWSKGGKTEESNLQMLCRSCNNDKRDK